MKKEPFVAWMISILLAACAAAPPHARTMLLPKFETEIPRTIFPGSNRDAMNIPPPTATTDILHTQIIQAYQLVVLAQANAVLLVETAQRYVSGLLEDAQLMSALIALNATMMTLDEVALEISTPAILAPEMRDAMLLSMASKTVVERWLRGELDAARVIVEMRSILESFDTVVLDAERGLSSGYSFDLALLRSIRNSTLDMLMQQILAVQAGT